MSENERDRDREGEREIVSENEREREKGTHTQKESEKCAVKRRIRGGTRRQVNRDRGNRERKEGRMDR